MAQTDDTQVLSPSLCHALVFVWPVCYTSDLVVKSVKFPTVFHTYRVHTDLHNLHPSNVLVTSWSLSEHLKKKKITIKGKRMKKKKP